MATGTVSIRGVEQSHRPYIIPFQRGFTLIEVLVTISIVAILVPSYCLPSKSSGRLLVARSVQTIYGRLV